MKTRRSPSHNHAYKLVQLPSKNIIYCYMLSNILTGANCRVSLVHAQRAIKRTTVRSPHNIHHGQYYLAPRYARPRLGEAANQDVSYHAFMIVVFELPIQSASVQAPRSQRY
jgi:hypothetical protein